MILCDGLLKQAILSKSTSILALSSFSTKRLSALTRALKNVRTGVIDLAVYTHRDTLFRTK